MRDLIRAAAGPLIFPAGGGTELDMELPKTSAYNALVLDLAVDYTVGTAAGTAATTIWDIIRNIRLVADGKLTLASLDGPALRQLNRIWYASIPSETAFALATAVYNAQLILPIAPPYLFDLSVGLLPAVPLTGLQLFVTAGTPAHLAQTPGTSAVNSITVAVDTIEVLDLADELAVSPQVISQITHNVVTGTEQEVRLRTGNRLCALLMQSKADSGSVRVPNATFPSLMQLRITAESTGPQILRRQNSRMNRALTRIRGSGVYGGQGSDLEVGAHYFNFHSDGRKSTPLDTSGRGTDVYLLLDETAAGTNPQVKVTQVEMIPRPV